jgi:Lrp/AsnC family leucine-responsive transcriptional regulator
MDDIDREIVRMLRENARTSNAEIARQVGLAPSAIFQRIRKLEDSGLIQGYTVRTDGRLLGYGLMAFVMLRTNDSARDVDTAAELGAIPEVQEVHRVVGEDCFFVKLRVRDTDDLGRILEERVQRIPSIGSTRTTIVVKTTKESIHVPLEDTAMVA